MKRIRELITIRSPIRSTMIVACALAAGDAGEGESLPKRIMSGNEELGDLIWMDVTSTVSRDGFLFLGGSHHPGDERSFSVVSPADSAGTIQNTWVIPDSFSWIQDHGDRVAVLQEQFSEEEDRIVFGLVDAAGDEVMFRDGFVLPAVDIYDVVDAETSGGMTVVGWVDDGSIHLISVSNDGMPTWSRVIPSAELPFDDVEGIDLGMIGSDSGDGIVLFGTADGTGDFASRRVGYVVVVDASGDVEWAGIIDVGQDMLEVAVRISGSGDLLVGYETDRFSDPENGFSGILRLDPSGGLRWGRRDMRLAHAAAFDPIPGDDSVFYGLSDPFGAAASSFAVLDVNGDIVSQVTLEGSYLSAGVSADGRLFFVRDSLAGADVGYASSRLSDFVWKRYVGPQPRYFQGSFWNGMFSLVGYQVGLDDEPDTGFGTTAVDVFALGPDLEPDVQCELFMDVVVPEIQSFTTISSFQPTLTEPMVTTQVMDGEFEIASLEFAPATIWERSICMSVPEVVPVKIDVSMDRENRAIDVRFLTQEGVVYSVRTSTRITGEFAETLAIPGDGALMNFKLPVDREPMFVLVVATQE